MDAKFEKRIVKKTGILLLIGFVFAVFAVLLTPEAANASIDQVRGGIEATGEAPAGVDVNSIIATVINIFSFVVGVIAVIMIIVGGLKYITSTGDSSKTESAKNTILYAVIGLVIVAVAQVIVIFVLDEVQGEDSSGESEESSIIEPRVV